MEIIESKIRTSSSEYKENFEDLKQKVESLRNLIRKIELGSGEKAIERHKGRGKLTARERVSSLIDPGTSFLEFSPLAAEGVYSDSVPSAGILTGIGRICGVDCVIVANDATVKGGTYYPLTVKNIYAHKRSLFKIFFLVFILWIQEEPFFRCKTKCFQIKIISEKSFITKPIFPR